MSRYTIRERSDINFGKHKGKSGKWVVENDPEYMVWLIKNTTMRIKGDIREILINKGYKI